jgi:hypothetical protein
MSKIIKYTVNDPHANLMIIENAFIENNTVTLDEGVVGDIFLPNMYQPWFQDQPPHHIKFKTENTPEIDVSNDVLYVFDSWGWSSYYHLLIEHVIPMWITKNYMEQFL